MVFSSLQDEIEGNSREVDILPISTKQQSYKLRVERYLRENAHMLAIQRVRKGEKLTIAELETLEKVMFDGGLLGGHQRRVSERIW